MQPQKKLLQHITVESISCNNTHQVTQGISGQNLLSKILQQCSRILSVQSVKCTQISFLFFSLQLIPGTNFSLKKVARFSSYVKGGKLLSQSTMYHSNLSSGGLNRTGLINWKLTNYYCAVPHLFLQYFTKSFHHSITKGWLTTFGQ